MARQRERDEQRSERRCSYHDGERHEEASRHRLHRRNRQEDDYVRERRRGDRERDLACTTRRVAIPAGDVLQDDD